MLVRMPLCFMLLVVSAVFTGCRPSSCPYRDDGMQGDTLPMAHARLLVLVQYPQYTLAEVRSPWDSARLLQRYVLVSRTADCPDSLPDGIVLRVPLQRVVLGSAVHCALWSELQAASSVVGICDVPWLMSAWWKEAVRCGRVTDMGASYAPDAERILAASCDAVFLSPFESNGHGAVEKTGVPVVECADYMEASPLGRAEWMRFYGRLLGCADRADSLFAAVEKCYNNLAETVRDVTERPTVMWDLLTPSGIWYQPGPSSTIGRMVADAGARLPFTASQANGSVPLNVEQVLSDAHDARFWLVRYGEARPLTYASLASAHASYSRFDAWRNHHVWVCPLKEKPFFEQTPFHPERLLENLIHIFHPSVPLPDSWEEAWFQPLSR